MLSHTKLEGADNFWAWKYRISLILEDNDLDKYVTKEFPKLEGEEAKATYKKNMIRANMIISDSIKDHLIPYVSSLETPKQMFDALIKLFEGTYINRKMTLRNQLKNVNIQHS